MDQGSNKNHSPAYNFAPTVTKFCVMWEGLSLPHDTKFGNCRCKTVVSRAFPSWSLIHGLRWSGLIKAKPVLMMVKLAIFRHLSSLVFCLLKLLTTSHHSQLIPLKHGSTFGVLFPTQMPSCNRVPLNACILPALKLISWGTSRSGLTMNDGKFDGYLLGDRGVVEERFQEV